MYNYAYFFATLFLGLVWFLFFLKRKDLRKQQLFVSILVAPVAPISQILFFAKDYWSPEYVLPIKILGAYVGIEEILFGFFIGGIGSVFYEIVFARKHDVGRKRTLETILIVAGMIILFLILKRLGINTIWASITPLFISSVVLLFIDKDLRRDSLMSAVLMVFMILIVYVAWLKIYPDAINRLWVQDGLSGVAFAKIPIEEIVWFFAWGMFSGVVYEFWINVDRYKMIRK